MEQKCGLGQFFPKRRCVRYAVAETAIERDSAMPYNFTEPIKPMFHGQENARLKRKVFIDRAGCITTRASENTHVR